MRQGYELQHDLESYPLAKSECEYPKHPGKDFLNKLSHLNLESVHRLSDEDSQKQHFFFFKAV